MLTQEKVNVKAFQELVKTVMSTRKANEDTTDLENQIDQLVYQLYELTDDEIKIIEGNGQ